MGGSLILQLEPSVDTKSLIAKLIQDNLFPSRSAHLIQGDSSFSNDETQVSESLTMQSHIFFSEPEKILAKDGVYHKFEITSSTSKEDLRNQIESLATATQARGLSENVIAIFEELYMNAVYDGPAEFNKRFKDRTRNSESFDPRRISISIGISGDRFIIACRDEYGSLDPMSYLKRIHEVYDKGVGQSIRYESNAGAGIGSYIVLENCQSLYFGVIPQKCTVVASVLNMQLTRKQREVVPKNIHYVSCSEGGQSE